MTRLQVWIATAWMLALLARIVQTNGSGIALGSGEKVFFVCYATVAYLVFFTFVRFAAGTLYEIFHRRSGSPSGKLPWTTAASSTLIAFFYLFFLIRYFFPSFGMMNPKRIALNAAAFIISISTGIIFGKWESARFRTGKENTSRKSSGAIAAAALLIVFATMAWYVNSFEKWNISFHPPRSGESLPGMPNVVVITVDTLSSYYTDFYFGGGTTPTLSKIAAEGMAFPDTVTPIPITASAHASILTGMPPQKHKVFNNGDRLPDDATTLAEILLANGYQTAAFTNVFACSPEFNFGQGFQSFYHEWRSDSAMRRRLITLDLFNLGDILAKTAFYRGMHPIPEHENLWLAKTWLQTQTRQPFFLWFHSYIPHVPYAPPERLKGKFGAGGFPDWSYSLSQAVLRENNMLPPEELEKLKGLYRAEIYLADASVSQIVETLRKTGVLDRTILVITGDHGETFQSHSPYIGHGFQMYEDILRVPLIFRFPAKIPKMGKINVTAQSVDVTPTILDLIGIRKPDYMEGVSLAPHLAKDAPSSSVPDTIYSETIPPQGDTYKLAIRKHGIKYIHDTGNGAESLYDITTDPWEQNNLISDRKHNATAADFRSMSKKWFETVRPVTEAGSAGMTRETSEHLKDLGYIR
jgi:arylsulfatase A-like enzyme